ncbi:general stress protein [Massilia arenosa]|uniref:General stress protein n=1 Tax=Zemynaea arenosa TaxID=2561931 RepID=A0A4Y9SF54_9BURK|nr:pyridoxamine 5'-phosphate oxidase family protein [Massilia arenosa]TFW21917.1 general stress protein [Massilia arenosa]
MTASISPTDGITNTPADLSAKIKHIRIAMVTSIDAHGHLVAHPMTNQDIDADSYLYFFTSNDSPLWHNIAANKHVNVSFGDIDSSVYVSVSGHAEQVEDRAKMKELWNPMVAAWFPQGVDDPKLALIRVHAHTAEYWDAHGGRMVQMWRMAVAAVTGHPPKMDQGEHGTMRLN